MTDVRSRMGIRKGEPKAVVRFVAVGILATLAYLGTSLLLLRFDWTPQIVHLLAFGVGLLVSYAGHYFFTYRSNSSHLATGKRFALVTATLLALCSAAQQLALWAGVSPQTAAFIVAVLYAGLSFLLNHFWTFSRRVGPA